MTKRSGLEREPAVPAVVWTVDAATRTAMLKVPAWDGGAQLHGPASYTAQPEPHPAEGAEVVSHPSRNTPCVLIEDSEGGLWIASWRYHQ